MHLHTPPTRTCFHSFLLKSPAHKLTPTNTQHRQGCMLWQAPTTTLRGLVQPVGLNTQFRCEQSRSAVSNTHALLVPPAVTVHTYATATKSKCCPRYHKHCCCVYQPVDTSRILRPLVQSNPARPPHCFKGPVQGQSTDYADAVPCCALACCAVLC